MNGKNSFEEELKNEIHNSQIYRNIGNDGRRIVDSVVNTAEFVKDDINRAFNDNSWASAQKGQKPNYNPPPVNNYPPPTNYSKPKPPVENKPKKDKKKKKEKPKYHFPAIRVLLIIAAFVLPLVYLPFDGILVPLIAAFCGISSIYLTNWIFKVRAKKEVKQELPKQEPKTRTTGNEELDKVISEGRDYIIKLKEANDAIPHEQLSESIERMEKASFDIFTYVEDHPEKIPQIKKFMNYYLPTTLKLLQNYQTLSTQSVKGETISSTMYEIECMMYTVASAFEKQLDSLFSQEAMDIGVDISVFDSILKQEGLKEDKTTQIK